MDEDETWTRQTAVSAHLHEGLPETGFKVPTDDRDESGLLRFTRTWERPKLRSVKLASGTLKVVPRLDTEIAYAPNVSMRTWLDAVYLPDAPLTLNQFDCTFGYPLLAFTAFAANRPDALVREIVAEPGTRRFGVVLRAGQEVMSREWRPNGHYLFQAHDVADEMELLRRWFELYDRAGPSLATFVDTIQLGNSYSRPRLIALVTALESLWRALAIGKASTVSGKLHELQRYSEIPDAVNGCGSARLALVARARNYYAHLGRTRAKWPAETIDDTTLDNCRCATALMPSCILRALSVPRHRSAELLEAYYGGWALLGPPGQH